MHPAIGLPPRSHGVPATKPGPGSYMSTPAGGNRRAGVQPASRGYHGEAAYPDNFGGASSSTGQPGSSRGRAPSPTTLARTSADIGRVSELPWWQAKLGCLYYSCFCEAPYVKCDLGTECDTEVVLCHTFDEGIQHGENACIDTRPAAAGYGEDFNRRGYAEDFQNSIGVDRRLSQPMQSSGVFQPPPTKALSPRPPKQPFMGESNTPERPQLSEHTPVAEASVFGEADLGPRVGIRESDLGPRVGTDATWKEASATTVDSSRAFNEADDAAAAADGHTVTPSETAPGEPLHAGETVPDVSILQNWVASFDSKDGPAQIDGVVLQTREHARPMVVVPEQPATTETGASDVVASTVAETSVAHEPVQPENSESEPAQTPGDVTAPNPVSVPETSDASVSEVTANDAGAVAEAEEHLAPAPRGISSISAAEAAAEEAVVAEAEARALAEEAAAEVAFAQELLAQMAAADAADGDAEATAEAAAPAPEVAADTDAVAGGSAGSDAGVNSAEAPEGDAAAKITKKGRAISDRLQAYQDACKSPEKVSPNSTPARAPSTASKLQKLSLSGSSDPARPARKLANVSEQRVLKTGIVGMHRDLVVNAELQVPVSDLPTKTDGSPLLKTQGAFFLLRLLREGIELKACMDTDAAAAQADVRYLRTEQLLTIRSKTLDFLTAASTHTARSNFLEIVDKHLFEKLARQLLRGSIAAPERPQPLHSLGLRLTLILGVVEMMEGNWGDADGDLLAIPKCWAIKLDEADWPDKCQAAIFNSSELWVQPLPGDNPDFAGFSAGELVAVVKERSHGEGQSRMLNWEVVALDPQSDNVLEELIRVAPQRGNRLADELARALPDTTEVRTAGAEGLRRELANELAQTLPDQSSQSALEQS